MLLVAWAAWRFVAQSWAVIAAHRAGDERTDSVEPDARKSTDRLPAAAPSGEHADAERARREMADPGKPPVVEAAGEQGDATATIGPLSPEIWRLDSRAVRILRRCLNQVQLATAADATIVFAAPTFDDSSFAFAWVEYLLPERRFVLRADLADWRGADWLLSYGSPLVDRRLAAGQRLFCGWLYAVEPGIPAAGETK